MQEARDAIERSERCVSSARSFITGSGSSALPAAQAVQVPRPWRAGHGRIGKLPARAGPGNPMLLDGRRISLLAEARGLGRLVSAETGEVSYQHKLRAKLSANWHMGMGVPQGASAKPRRVARQRPIAASCLGEAGVTARGKARRRQLARGHVQYRRMSLAACRSPTAAMRFTRQWSSARLCKRWRKIVFSSHF